MTPRHNQSFSLHLLLGLYYPWSPVHPLYRLGALYPVGHAAFHSLLWVPHETDFRLESRIL